MNAIEIKLLMVSFFLLLYACNPVADEQINEEQSDLTHAICEAPEGVWAPIPEKKSWRYRIIRWGEQTAWGKQHYLPIVPLLSWEGDTTKIMQKYSTSAFLDRCLRVNETNGVYQYVYMKRDSIATIKYNRKKNELWCITSTDTVRYKHIIGRNLISKDEFYAFKKQLNLTSWEEVRDTATCYTLSFIDTIENRYNQPDPFFWTDLYVEGDSLQELTKSYMDTMLHWMAIDFPNEYTLLATLEPDSILYVYKTNIQHQLVKTYVLEKIEPDTITLIDVYEDEQVIWKKREGGDITRAQYNWHQPENRKR